MSPEPEQTKRLDARSLRGLAHPLRLRILSILRIDGPATATSLARQLGQDSGNVSWHLRQLAEHGFIAEDTERGTRRERWWYARHRSNEFDRASIAADADSSGPASLYLHHVLDQCFERALAFLDEDWSVEWQQASAFSGWQIDLTPAELRALTEELAAVIDRHRGIARLRPQAPDAVAAHVQLQTFPRRRRAQ